MDYKAGGAADTTMLRKVGLAPLADGQSGGKEPPSDTDDLDAFWKAISLQAEARAARYAISSRAISEEFGRGGTRFIEIEREKRLSRRRSLDLMLTVALGVALCAAIIYFTLGMHLHSPV